MDNLKITINLKTPLIANRMLTIDSILLAVYYKELAKAGKPIKEIDPEHKSVQWIERKKGILSGSIWYIDRTEHIDFDFQTIVKKSDLKKMKDVTGKGVPSPEFKQAMISEELMLVDKIYFYINAKVEIVDALMKKVKNIGKMVRLDYGKVSGYTIEFIEEDKSFYLNANTPSKPLPCKDFDINSKKVAFHRKTPPYWIEEDKEACYMPTSSLYERNDNTAKESGFKAITDMNFIHNMDFIYEKAFDKKIKKPIKLKPDVKVLNNGLSAKKYPFEILENNDSLKCAITSNIAKRGFKGDIYSALTKGPKSNFSDFQYIKNGNFLSMSAAWCLDSMREIGYLFVSDTEWRYLQGKNAPSKEELSGMLKTVKKLKPPFSINLKDTANSQHIAFRNIVSISNAMFYIQYGTTRLLIDGELLSEAISDLKKITKENSDIKRYHLCRNFKDFQEVSLKNKIKNREVVEKTIMEFQKKYDKNIRNILAVVAL